MSGSMRSIGSDGDDSMQRKSRCFTTGLIAASAIAALIASAGAGAFTFTDGKPATCVAAGKTVEEVEAEPGQPGLGFTGKTVRTASGFQIIWNVEKLKTLPPEVRDYLFFHECAHARVPTADELQANCVGLQDMRAAGRGGFAVESRLAAFYGAGNDYWIRTLKCANAAGTASPKSQ
jgi:hypothetical protein